MAVDNGSGQIITHAHEAVKTYSVYDGSFRLTDFYTAPINAVTGTPCLLTHYDYDGASSRILKSREVPSVWNASYD